MRSFRGSWEVERWAQMRTCYRLAIAAAVSVAIVFGLASFLGNANDSPSASNEWSTPRWVYTSGAGTTTRVRPVDLPDENWGDADAERWIAERISGWPFPCLAFRVVDDGETRIRGGIAVGAGDLMLGPPRHMWRFPGLGRFVVPLQPVWLPFMGSTILMLAVVMSAIESLRLLQRTLRQRRRRVRVSAGNCPECAFPSGVEAARCPECGVERPIVNEVGTRCNVSPKDAGGKLRGRLVNAGMLVLLVAAIAVCVDWRGCVSRLHAMKGSSSVTQSTRERRDSARRQGRPHQIECIEKSTQRDRRELIDHANDLLRKPQSK